MRFRQTQIPMRACRLRWPAPLQPAFLRNRDIRACGFSRAAFPVVRSPSAAVRLAPGEIAAVPRTKQPLQRNTTAMSRASAPATFADVWSQRRVLSGVADREVDMAGADLLVVLAVW